MLGMFTAALADTMTGAEVWFGPVYLLLICFVTWTLGWREALAITAVSAVLLITINNGAHDVIGDTGTAWNVVIRILAVATIVVLLETLRRAYAKEWRLARTDALTGTLNRQAFLDWAATAGAMEGWSILVYADLDGLKRINDTWGHAAGDDALRAYTSSVRSMIRNSDVFARVGGDEFLLHMSVGGENDAYQVASRLHQRMNTASSDLIASIRCSLGVVVLRPGSRIEERHVRLADRSMYEAKALGSSLKLVDPDERGGSTPMSRPTQRQAA